MAAPLQVIKRDQNTAVTSYAALVADTVPGGGWLSRLLVISTRGGSSCTHSSSSTGWTKIGEAQRTTQNTVSVWFCTNSTNAANFTVAFTGASNSQRVQIQAWDFSDVDTIEGMGGAANNSSSNPNPASYATGVTRDYKWIGTAAAGTTSVYSAGPSGYSGFQQITGVTAPTSNLGMAYKDTTATATEDCGLFTVSSSNWVAFTIASYLAGGGGSTQNLTPGLVSRTKTIYAPTVVQSQALTPPLLARSKGLFAPTVSVGAVDVLPPLVSRIRILYAPEVVAGSVTLTPGLLTRSKDLFPPSIVVGAVNLAPPLVERDRAIYPPTVLQEGQAAILTPPLVVRSREIFAPSVSQEQVGPVDYLNPLADWVPQPSYDNARRKDIAELFAQPTPEPQKTAKPEPDTPKAIPADTFTIERIASLEGRLSVAAARREARRIIEQQYEEEATLLLLAA